MIPIRHTLAPRATPIVNRAIVIANCVVFVAQIFLGERTENVINIFGYIPARLMNPAAYGYSMFEVTVTLITSLFLHGGFVHLAGNMIYLWVFGGAVEDVLGHARYAIFFVVCGAIGSLTHTLLFPHSTVPSIGASGSIAGILGAFLVLRPKARIVTLLPLVVYWAMIELR
ncbi:MAG TPA: rhomboid family intramembrane serine protease, partial [Thermoanaerobaculia bacterium]